MVPSASRSLDMTLPGWPMPWPVVHFLVLLALVAAVALRARWEEVVGAVGGDGGACSACCCPTTCGPWAIGQALLAGVALLVRWLVISRRQLAIETVSTQEERARRAVLEERSMIARELHDVVAHHMSLIVVQSQSAPYRLGGRGRRRAGRVHLDRAVGPGRAQRGPRRARRAALGVARGRVRAASPVARDLAALLESSRAAGLPLTWAPLPAAVATLPPGVGLAAYRILQESLANASRHAPGAAVRADGRRWTTAACRWSVENTAAPRPPGPAARVRRGQRPASALARGRAAADAAGGIAGRRGAARRRRRVPGRGARRAACRLRRRDPGQ